MSPTITGKGRNALWQWQEVEPGGLLEETRAVFVPHQQHVMLYTKSESSVGSSIQILFFGKTKSIDGKMAHVNIILLYKTLLDYYY